MARPQIVYGEGWETFGEVPLDATIDFQHVAVFFSHVPAEQVIREAAVRNGVHVISEQHLARYYQATVDTTPVPVRPLQAHTKEELPL